jgi:hypothetical protein
MIAWTFSTNKFLISLSAMRTTLSSSYSEHCYCCQNPLHRDDLKHFVGNLGDGDDWRINVILHSLSSVLKLNGFLRLRHLSFAELLTGAKRCHNQCFVVNPGERYHHLALACLRIMNTELKFNTCELETSYTRNDDATDLPERIVTMIPTRWQYSCRSWAAHLCELTGDLGRSDSLLQEVCLLYWLEVMSLIKEVPASLITLLAVAQLERINVSF